MKKTRSFVSFLSCFNSADLRSVATATASIVLCMGFSQSQAATIAWDGNNVSATDLGTALNWVGDILPSPSVPDTAQWNGTVAGPLSLVYSNAVFAGAAGNAGLNLDITAAQTSALSLDSGTNTGSIRMNGLSVALGAGSVTFGDGANTFSLTLGGAAGTHTWTNESTNPVTLNSDVTFGLGGAGAHVLSLGGAGNWQLNNNITPASGTLTIAKNGAGTATLAGTIPAATTTISAFQINGGILDLAKDVPLGGATLISGSGGTINATGGGRILLNVAAGDLGVANGGTLTVNSVIANGTVGSIDFWNTASGTGVVVLNAANTFNGTTNLQSGIISVGTIGNSGVAGNLGQSGTFNIGATTSAATLRYTGAGETNNRVLNLSGTTGGATVDQSGTGLLKFTSNLTAGGAGLKTLNLLGSTAGTGELSGIIPDSTVATSVFKGGSGKWTLSGASTFTGSLTVAGGTLDFSGSTGTNGGNGNFRIGTVTSTPAVLNILPGAALNNRFNLFVGDAGTGTGGGAVYQSGGSLALSQVAGIDNLRVGSNSTGYGYYNLSGGTVTSVQPAIGASLLDTVGVVDVTGGTFVATGQLHIAAGSASSSGLLNVTGGAVTAGTDIRFLQVQAGTAGATSQGVLNVGGGLGLASVTTGNAASVGLNLAQTNNVAGALGVANLLTNGTLTTGRVLGGQANPTTRLNFNGGTLKATAINSGTTFMTDANLDVVNVFSGGGTIDNSDTAITISNGLLAPTGSGVNAITVSTGGSGYIGAPLVKITGGSGAGATGYATISGGAVTGVTVTSRGIGYQNTDTLAVTFFGGGGTGAAATISGAQITANTSGGMTFAGGSSGSTTLSGTNTYTGSTSVSSGKLYVTGSLAAGSAVSVSSGATLGGTGTVNGTATVASGGNLEGGVASIGKLTLGGLNFSGAANVNLGILSNYVATSAVGVGAMNLSGGAGAVVINIASLGTATAGNTYKLFDYSSLGGAGFSGFSLAALPSRGIGNLVNTGTGINLALTSLDYLKWTGTLSSDWNTATANWKLNSTNAASNYINSPGDSVVFDDSSSNPNVDISTVDVTPTSVVFNNNVNDYFIQGSKAIAGLTGIVKNNGAAVSLALANTYSGGTTLNAGTLNINNASAIGTGALTIAGGTIDSTFGITLTTNNAQNWNSDFTFTGSADLNMGTGAVAMSASRVITTNGSTFTAGGIVSGTGMSLTKNGIGTLVLGGVNTYNGGTNLNAGTLQLNQTTGAAATGTFNLAGGTLVFNPPGNNFGYAPAINLTADAAISKIGNFQINYTGVLTGTGNVANVSTSASRFYMNGTVSGITQFNVTSGAMGFDLNIGNRGGSAPVNVSNGASLWLANATNTVANNITLNGGTGQGGTGALFQEGNGNPIISGSVTLASGDSSIGGNTATGNVTISGNITGSGSLNKIGVNKYIFSGANTYTGGTTINAGTLAAGVASVPNVSGAFGNNSAVSFANTAGALMDITGFNTQVGSLSGGGATGGNITLGAATLTTGGDNTSPAAYAGAISGTGGLVKIGTGTQILAGANSSTGDITVNGGILIANRGNNAVNPVTSALGNPQVAHNITVNSATLNLAQGDTLGGATSIIAPTLVINAGGVVTNTSGFFNSLGPVTLNGGTLTTTGGAVVGYQSYSLAGDVTVGGSVASTISVTGGGNAFNGIHLGTNTVFNVSDATSSAASDLDVSAPLINRNQSLTGVGGLTKSGPGTMTMTGVNAYTGDTIVTAGTLSISNANLADTADVRLTTGAKLDLTFSAGTPDTIDELYIDGVQQAIGTWGAIGSGAAHTTALITGTGMLNVTTGTASAYTTWESSYSLGSGTENGDPDSDGIKNLMEYVLGGVPTGAGASDTSILPTQALDATNLVLTFHRSDLSESEVTVKVQWSTDMVTWNDFATIGATSALPAVQVTEDSPTTALDTVVVTIPRSGHEVGGKLFGRVIAVK